MLHLEIYCRTNTLPHSIKWKSIFGMAKANPIEFIVIVQGHRTFQSLIQTMIQILMSNEHMKDARLTSQKIRLYDANSP